MQYDVIIIGSGLAGLAAGARLSKEGKIVLLIEQHKRVGGCATYFKRKGYRFEVGLHELNGTPKIREEVCMDLRRSRVRPGSTGYPRKPRSKTFTSLQPGLNQEEDLELHLDPGL
jgi:phytoene dehydrogenase-like protein